MEEIKNKQNFSPATGFDVSGLEDYTKENRLPLLAKSILGAHTLDHVTIQGDCRGNKVAINILDVDAPFQDGSQCGWDANGTAKFTQRMIEPVPIKINMSLCDKDLLKKWNSYEVQVSALPEDKRLPFEEYIMNQLADSIKAKIEKYMWVGDADNAGQWDGFLTIAGDDANINSLEDAAAGTAVYEVIKNVYMATPEAVADKDDYEIYVSPSLFRQFIQELVAANLYHFNPNDDRRTYLLPGTNVPVISIEGLEGENVVVAARKSNLFAGVDMASDSSDISVWYSKDNREHRIAVEFVMGAQYAFSDEITMQYIATDDNNGSGTGDNNSGTQGSQGSQG